MSVVMSLICIVHINDKHDKSDLRMTMAMTVVMSFTGLRVCCPTNFLGRFGSRYGILRTPRHTEWGYFSIGGSVTLGQCLLLPLWYIHVFDVVTGRYLRSAIGTVFAMIVTMSVVVRVSFNLFMLMFVFMSMTSVSTCIGTLFITLMAVLVFVIVRHGESLMYVRLQSQSSSSH